MKEVRISMKNPFLNVKRIEFAVTYYCSGKCKHCSVAPNFNKQGCGYVDPQKAAEAVEKLTDIFDIDSLMTFGGEPLIYTDVTCQIQNKAFQKGITNRQLITNGFFSKNADDIRKTALSIRNAGINDILISVDAFHQETIPLEFVRLFAEALLAQNVESIQFHPAWVVNSSHQNRYNELTNRILDSLSDLKIGISRGNDIFPSGNAGKYLQEFYQKPNDLNLTVECGKAPYTSRLDDVHVLFIEPNGDAMICAFTIGNIYKEDIKTLIERYNPYDNKMMKLLMDGGVKSLVEYAQSRGEVIDTSDCYSACSVCKKTVAALNASSLA